MIGRILCRINDRQFAEAKQYADSLGSNHWNTFGDSNLERLKVIWSHCVSDIPYYENLVSESRAPERIASWDDFRMIPELTRSDLQSNFEKFQRRSLKPSGFRKTGGSTGQPVKFGISATEDKTLRILKLVLWNQCGYRSGDSIFLLWGHSHLLGTGLSRYKNHAVRKIKDAVVGYHRFDAYRLNPEVCEKLAKRLIQLKPVGIIGYAAALDYFVRNTEVFHDSFTKLSLKFIMPCAEPAPKDDTHDLFHSVFKCPIIQEFGGVDFGQVGMKYDNEPFKVFPNMNLLECISGDSENEGDALVTTLYDRYLPLIRYRQGDVISGVKRDKNGFVQEFDELKGRANDMVALPGGESVHSVAFLHCVHQEPAIINAQLYLDDCSKELRVVSKGELGCEVEGRIRGRIGQLSPQLEKLEIVRVVDLETSVAGKRRWLIDRRSAK